MAFRPFRQVASWVNRHWRELTWSLVAYAAFEAVNHLYDFGAFPYLIAVLGPLWGGVAATTGALGINAFVYWSYDFFKWDWLRAKVLDGLADKESKTALEELLTWHRQKRDAPREKLHSALVFMALTLPLDPVVVAVYYRESYFSGISRRDWLVLLAATLSACLLWLFMWELVVPLVLWYLTTPAY